MNRGVPYWKVIHITFVRYHSQAKRYVHRGADKEVPLPMRDTSFRHHARVPKLQPEDPPKKGLRARKEVHHDHEHQRT
jgi:hypothetical protein